MQQPAATLECGGRAKRRHRFERLTFLLSVAAFLCSFTLLRAADTPTQQFPGAESRIYAPSETPAQSLSLHIVKPANWRATDKRPALIWFFGGAWARGTPANSIGWAKLAATWGMIGIAPDYRTKERFNSSPLDSVADARAAYAWVIAHAAELGIDPARIVVGGNSAGAHLALWTAITHAPDSPDLTQKPAALVLTATPADLSAPQVIARFGPHITDVSPLQHLDAKMPPAIMFHGTADKTVPYKTVTPLVEKLKTTGNICEFITVENAGHNFASDKPEWREKSRAMIKEFLTKQNILPCAQPSTPQS